LEVQASRFSCRGRHSFAPKKSSREAQKKRFDSLRLGNLSTEINTYIGIGLAVLGIAATIYLAIRFSEQKDPRFHTVNVSRITRTAGAPSDIDIFYKGERVDQVSSFMVWIWNAGRRPIKSDDIPTSQPITLSVDPAANFRILDVAVRKVSRESIRFAARKQSETVAAIDFEFLDYQDGALIEIQHTGTRNARLNISGVILGAPKGIRDSHPSRILDAVASFPPLAVFAPLTSSEFGAKHAVLRRVFGALLAILFIGLGIVLFRIPREITTSPDLLMSALRNAVPEETARQLVNAITAADNQTSMVLGLISCSAYSLLTRSAPY
jgi:hypothetical protein